MLFSEQWLCNKWLRKGCHHLFNVPLGRETNLKASWRKVQSRAALNKENTCVPLWTVSAGLANHKDIWAAEISLWFVLRQWCGHMTAMWHPHRALWDRDTAADPSDPWPFLPEGMEYKLAPPQSHPSCLRL